MRSDVRTWFDARVSTAADWPVEALLAAKQASGSRVSVVVPARNEQRTVAAVITGIRSELIETVPLVDELVVMDSLSTDATAAAARDAGATVHSVAEVRPELGVRAGKGEALWKSLFVTDGDVLVFVDADLTEWGPHFVTGLLGPLLTNAEILLVKGFYDRLLDIAPGTRSSEGGRVTELMARPLLAARWPLLAAVVQPLAGEWAIRRSLFERLPVPVGYGVEMATLLDTWREHGLAAIAQVDLGARGHRHQSVHDLGVMAVEILRVADRRSALGAEPTAGDPAVDTAVGTADRPADEQTVTLAQYDRAAESGWRLREVPVAERPPAASID